MSVDNKYLNKAFNKAISQGEESMLGNVENLIKNTQFFETFKATFEKNLLEGKPPIALFLAAFLIGLETGVIYQGGKDVEATRTVGSRN